MKPLIFLLIFISVFTKAQLFRKQDMVVLSLILLSRIEATGFGENTYFSFGAKYPISTNQYLSLRGHFNAWNQNKKIYLIPEIDYIYNLKSFKERNVISNIFVGAGSSTRWVSPKAGLTFYHFFSVETGYHFPFDPNSQLNIKGFRWSVGINFFLPD